MCEELTVPFSARNAIWSVAVHRPYIPHRDPENSANYIPPPDPLKDPNWVAPALPPLNGKQEPRDVTDATIPSVNSERDEENSNPPQTHSGHRLAAETVEPLILNLKINVSSEHVVKTQDQPPPSEISLDEHSNTAVRSASADSFSHELDAASPPSMLESASIITVIADDQWKGVSPQDYLNADNLPLRPATAFEQRKLDNVMFDCDGHIGFTPQISSIPPSSIRRRAETRQPHVDDFESASFMPPSRKEGTASKAECTTQTPHYRVDKTGVASFADVLTPNGRGRCQCTIKMTCAYCLQRKNELEKEQKIVDCVTACYERWGIHADDAYADVITGFHRVGSPSKKMCLGVGLRGGAALVEFCTWSNTHTKFTLYIDDYCAVTESVKDDQVIKCVKDTLWILYNHGAPSNVIVIDKTARDFVVGRFATATLSPLEILESLVCAWGAQYRYIKRG